MGQQYRTRPLTQITDQRFIDTTTLASAGDDTVGVELAAIHKSLHVAAEAQKVWVRDAFSSITLDPDNNDTPNGTLLNGDPSFWGGYFEVGYFLTGETRGYKGGRWDRTKVLKPWSEGGWGAFQVNGRVDYVDLSDRVDDAPTTGLAFSAPYYVNGGKQLGLQASLIWNPVDWVRFLAQVGHLEVTGGPRALGLVDPAKALNKRSFGVDTFAARAQVEF
jgi:phosphate-selective porin OprO/OprP